MGLTNSGKKLSPLFYHIEHILHFYIFNYGTDAVAIFIVLSGYLLMLPVARHPEMKLKGGVSGFIIRRARRILPPYYAALFISLVTIKLLRNENIFHVIAIPLSLTNDSIITHLFLIHNLTKWIFTIDGPMWSVGVEWQIYFLFALILLPIFRRFGPLVLVIITSLIFILPAYTFLPILLQSHPWFILLFIFGMTGSCINFSKQGRYVTLHKSKIWNNLYLIFLILTIIIIIIQDKYGISFGGSAFQEISTGLCILCFIIKSTKQLLSDDIKHSFIIRILQIRTMEILGVFSYSLYLVHDIVISFLAYMFSHSIMNSNIIYIVYPISSFALSLILAYGFHLAFEKKFLPSKLHAPTDTKSNSVNITLK